MKKARKPKVVRCGSVVRVTRAIQVVGRPEIGTPVLSYVGG